MFEFSKRRLAEIESLVLQAFEEQKLIEQHRVTKLDNEACINPADVQKEMMRGKYRFNLNSSLPFGHNIVKLANEPVAY